MMRRLGLPPRRGLVLLAAGCGQRMRPLTDGVPKALLGITGDGRGRTVLDAMLDSALAAGDREVVVVTGFAAERVQAHVDRRYGGRVCCVRNTRWAEDVNIASVACGVAALGKPEHGYLIIETDLLLDGAAWAQLLGTVDGDQESYWVCRGRYGAQRTGGVVHADASGRIDVVDYRPVYDPACKGWPKMLGMLAVGAPEVATDIALREAAIEESIGQYYLMPWKYGLDRLNARVLTLEAGFAETFNTVAEFESACRGYLACSDRAVSLTA